MEVWIWFDVYYFLMIYYIKFGWENFCDVMKFCDYVILFEIFVFVVFGNFWIVCRSCFVLNFDICNINMLNGCGFLFFFKWLIFKIVSLLLMLILLRIFFYYFSLCEVEKCLWVLVCVCVWGEGFMCVDLWWDFLFMFKVYKIIISFNYII